MLVTRAVAGTGADNVTVSQQAVQLTCGTVYAPTTAEINEDLTNPGINVSQTYTYCVQANGATGFYVPQQVGNGSFIGVPYTSVPTCLNATIEWAGQVSISVNTPQNTPVPGVMVSEQGRSSWHTWATTRW